MILQNTQQQQIKCKIITTNETKQKEEKKTSTQGEHVWRETRKVMQAPSLILAELMQIQA